MNDAVIAVSFAGPHVSIQDGGRHGMMRFGVPESGPMDRRAFASANAALGNPPGQRAIEISMGGLSLKCLSGEVSFAVAGGGFIVNHGETVRGSWTVATLRAGEKLVIRPGFWGSWCYLAFAGDLVTPEWLSSASTHIMSGFGGGRLSTGQQLHIANAERRDARHGDLPCPVSARPRSELRITYGPQDRFFSDAAQQALRSERFRMTAAGDRMGVRLDGPLIAPEATLDMPSEPIMRGSIQVAGDGVATVLLADHQTTGGYPKIATVLDCDLDGFVQLRPGHSVMFRPVTAEAAIGIARTAARAATTHERGLRAALTTTDK